MSEKTVEQTLVQQNEAIFSRLTQAGFKPDQLIYVQIHDAGSSSPVMLNLLRDAARLEQRGCRLLDSRNTLDLARVTGRLGAGAVIYVDDFVGTGTQFCEARNFTADFLEGSFSEFLLAPCVCEEGVQRILDLGVEVFAGHVHAQADRPLHENSVLLDKPTKDRLIEVCYEIDPVMGLGWLQSATMVIMYKNAPDNTPRIFRGSPAQKPFVGLFPRSTDMPL